ncbi:MAG: PAS domain-containing protein [Gemmatimonadetes bacterium]|nr:PAS domain-containing protein [Gemmatimonadota bacterium]
MTDRQQKDPFTGHGEVAARCRAIDWSASPLGPVDGWPAALRSAVSTCLESPFPMSLWCGDELILVYNDAYSAVLGDKHPDALGRSGRNVWSEIWDVIEPMFTRIRDGGPPAYAEDAPFVVRREHGDEAYADDEPNAWFTFALSPLRDERGDIVAFVNIVSESTGRVLAERALKRERANAEHAEERLREVFTQAPAFMAVLRGEKHVFEYVNSAYYQLIGHRDIINKPVAEALPEIRGQGFESLLDQVLATGEPYVGREIPVNLERSPDTGPEQRFLDFVYYPLTEADGSRTGVVAHGSDVTDHVVSRREAQRARQEAEDASRAKSQFLANMSHEIRTPINAIVGYTDLLSMGITGPVSDAQKEQLGRVRSSSQHLLTIVEDVLDVSKVEAGRMEVERDRVMVAETVTAALALVRPQAGDKGIALFDDCPGEEAAYFMGDGSRVRQILVNLLSNAIKFTASGGEVRISCGVVEEAPPKVEASATGPLTFVNVSDTGIGIEPAELQRVFEPFMQVDGGPTSSGGGTGLGLTISRHLAQLMGGDLTVESEPGRGSTFTLWLPNDRAPLDDTAMERVHESAPPNLAATGMAVRETMPDILARYMERLRREPLIPHAHELGEADLEDHASTFLIDIAQSLVALETSEVHPDRLLQDGSEIQRVVAELHGRQRARLGWSHEALHREWDILREEIETAVRGELAIDAESGRALELLKQFLDRGERISERTRSRGEKS